MIEIEGVLRPVGRVGILVSRYHERVTARLLDGALACCQEAGIPEDQVEVIRVAGAFELGIAAAAAITTDRYACLVALGVVVRGETPHFEYVAGETARMLAELSIRELIPIGFGVLTTETLEQALARAGGAAGNKGYEATDAAIRSADLLSRLPHPDD